MLLTNVLPIYLIKKKKGRAFAKRGCEKDKEQDLGTLLPCDRELEADSRVQSFPRFTHLEFTQGISCHVPGDSFSRSPDPHLSRPWETFASFSPKSIHSPSSEHLVRDSSSRKRDVANHFHLFVSRGSTWAGSQDPFPPTFSLLLLSSPQWSWGLHVLLPGNAGLSSLPAWRSSLLLGSLSVKERGLIQRSGRVEETCHRCKKGYWLWSRIQS